MSSYLVVAHKANLAAAKAAEAEDAPEPAPAAPKQARRRARTKAGAFVADDPSTPENEAWEPVA